MPEIAVTVRWRPASQAQRELNVRELGPWIGGAVALYVWQCLEAL